MALSKKSDKMSCGILPYLIITGHVTTSKETVCQPVLMHNSAENIFNMVWKISLT